MAEQQPTIEYFGDLVRLRGPMRSVSGDRVEFIELTMKRSAWEARVRRLKEREGPPIIEEIARVRAEG